MNLIHNLKIIFLILLWLGIVADSSFAQELRDAVMDSAIAQVRTDYGVNLHYAEGPKFKNLDIVYTLADLKDKDALKRVVLLFIQEINLYHKDFFKNARCEHIFFVQKLFRNKIPADGIFAEGTNFIFYDYSRQSDNAQKTRHNIHHEIYHLIGSRHPFWQDHGPRWIDLNRRGFAYNPKYNPHNREYINSYSAAESGFITFYAMAAAEEDRAEMFACMMLPEERRLLEQWAKKDVILLRKMALMNEFIKEYLGSDLK